MKWAEYIKTDAFREKQRRNCMKQYTPERMTPEKKKAMADRMRRAQKFSLTPENIKKRNKAREWWLYSEENKKHLDKARSSDKWKEAIMKRYQSEEWREQARDLNERARQMHPDLSEPGSEAIVARNKKMGELHKQAKRLGIRIPELQYANFKKLGAVEKFLDKVEASKTQKSPN